MGWLSDKLFGKRKQIDMLTNEQAKNEIAEMVSVLIEILV